jgi:hypothetical protein
MLCFFDGPFGGHGPADRFANQPAELTAAMPFVPTQPSVQLGNHYS